MKRKRYIMALIFTILMVIIAEYTGELEIIFPEILALLSGAWIAEKQPWKVNREQLFILMTLSAIMGVCIVKYLYIPLIFKISIAFTFAYIALIVTKTTIIPLISACILPILLNTSTWIYPISVGIMSILIVIIQYYMEKLNIRKKEVVNIVVEESSQTSEITNIKEIIIKYLKILLVIFVVAFIPTKTNNLYFIAPPLIVTFVEFSDIESPARNNIKKIFFSIVLASCVGTVLRIFLNVKYGLPLWVVALFVTICIFIYFEIANVIFPPAGAIGILPLLLNSKGLYLYPIEVVIGSFIFIFLALKIFKNKGISEELSYNRFGD